MGHWRRIPYDGPAEPGWMDRVEGVELDDTPRLANGPSMAALAEAEARGYAKGLREAVTKASAFIGSVRQDYTEHSAGSIRGAHAILRCLRALLKPKGGA